VCPCDKAITRSYCDHLVSVCAIAQGEDTLRLAIVVLRQWDVDEVVQLSAKCGMRDAQRSRGDECYALKKHKPSPKRSNSRADRFHGLSIEHGDMGRADGNP